MSKVFDDISLEWSGKTYSIPADRVLGAIARIEDHVSMADLYAMGVTGKVKLAQLARAFGAVLRYAGAKTTDDETYRGLFGKAKGTTAALDALGALLGMLAPPDREAASAQEQGKSEPTAAAS